MYGESLQGFHHLLKESVTHLHQVSSHVRDSFIRASEDVYLVRRVVKESEALASELRQEGRGQGTTIKRMTESLRTKQKLVRTH